MSGSSVGILRFLGTNCDRDIWQAVEALGYKPEWLWYEDQFEVGKHAAYFVPGGFSYGDYLRCGALAAKAPVMKSLREASEKGYPIMGICNGFQILCETELLPGALVRNEKRHFIDKWVELKDESGSRFKMPIAHGEGRFYAEDADLKELQDRGQVWLRYTENPNGSREDIAGVMSEKKNVFGLMPHPERAMFDWMGGADGRELLEKFFEVSK